MLILLKIVFSLTSLSKWTLSTCSRWTGYSFSSTVGYSESGTTLIHRRQCVWFWPHSSANSNSKEKLRSVQRRRETSLFICPNLHLTVYNVWAADAQNSTPKIQSLKSKAPFLSPKAPFQMLGAPKLETLSYVGGNPKPLYRMLWQRRPFQSSLQCTIFLDGLEPWESICIGGHR